MNEVIFCGGEKKPIGYVACLKSAVNFVA